MVRPQLKVLDQQALRLRARRRNVAMTMFMVLIVGFFAAALAQAQLVANQHELDGLRTQVAEADATRARLERAVEEASAPEAIINGAGELGMVRSNEPAYLVAVSDAPSVDVISVLGSTTAATGSAVAQTDPAGDEIMVAAPATADRTLVGPAVAGIAGARAVATGIGTG